MPARIVILNGVGSVGKSTTARALQRITNAPFLHVAMDVFLDMVPTATTGLPDGMILETVLDDDRPSVAISTGPVVERTLRGMRHAIGAMAGQGNNLIVDDVIMSAEEQQEYRDLLAAFDPFFVALLAPLEIIEARERARGDRMLGLARWQYDRVHAGLTYDLEIDTANASPMQCARRIKLAASL